MKNREQLARNILHRLTAEFLGETSGKLEMLVEKMLLEEINRFLDDDKRGLIALLSPEQLADALAYDGPVASGDSDLPKVRKRT